ncbi:MAG: TraB/GumN family protein [Pseudomonadota bacterium]
MKPEQRHPVRQGNRISLLPLVLLAFILSVSSSMAQSAGGIQFKTTEEVTADRSSTRLTVATPALWKATKGRSDIYLFGTIHILPDDLTWRTPAYDAAMKDAEITALEVESTSPEAQARMQSLIQEYGISREVTLEQRLGPARWRSLIEVTNSLDIDPYTLQNLEPWLAILVVTVSAFEQEGFLPDAGVDNAVETQALDEEDTLAYLETLETQIKALISLTADGDLAAFDASLAELDDFRGQIDRLLTSWGTGDTEAMTQMLINDFRELSEAAYNALFIQRNNAWLVQLNTMLDNPKDEDVFVAVGAAHLVGEDGLVEQLEAMGVRVERLQ